MQNFCQIGTARCSPIFLVQGLGFSAPTYNTPSWSISAELWTYLVFGLVAMVFSLYKFNILYMSIIAVISGAALYKLNFPFGTLTALDFGFIRCLCGFFTKHNLADDAVHISVLEADLNREAPLQFRELGRGLQGGLARANKKDVTAETR